MAYGIPLWNEETGWTPLDELPPGTLPANSGLITGGDPWGGGQPIPSSTYMTEYQDPRVIGSPQMLSGARSRGNTTPTIPPNSTAGNDAFNTVFGNGTTPRNTTSTGMPTFAPTGAQVQSNPSAYAGTSFDPARNLTSGYPTGGANNMGMTGAGTTSYNGQTYGAYTGANAPLNSQLFNQQAGNMQPELDYVRNIDQVNYYKYILPLQQAGLIDISNPQQVNAAIQQGLARDGGGQWASGSKTSNVQGSPYSAFLTSGDPRAQAINQFMLSGDQSAIAAANDWMSKNIDSNGRAKTALDNIQNWSQRFNSYYFPNGQFNSGSVSPGGSQQTPAGGGQQPVTPNTNWYQEFQSQNPAAYTQYNKALDSWALSQLSPSQRNSLTVKNDEASLGALRQALDNIRTQAGYGGWNDVNTSATGNKAQTGWLNEGYENAPFEPGADPGQFFKWDWFDPDGQQGAQVANWFLKMNDPKAYQDIQAAADYYNQNLKGKGRIIGNPYLLSQGDSFAPIAESLYGITGNQAWQQYNRQVNDYVSKFLDPNVGQFDFTNNEQSIRYLTEMDNLRKQMGYFTNSGMQQMAGQPSQLPLTAYGSSPVGTPFRPNASPLEGFQWSWMDPDQGGPAPGTWGQTLMGSPASIEQATKMAQAMSQNSNILFGGSNLGNVFTSKANPTGGYTFTPNTSYFQPKQNTQTSGFDYSTLFGSSYGPQNTQQSSPVSYGYTPQYSSGNQQTSAPTTTTPSTPFGGATNRKSNFANNYSYWG